MLHAGDVDTKALANANPLRPPSLFPVLVPGPLAVILALICALAMMHGSVRAQAVVPFEVQNPKHLNWSTEEAVRIYSSACELVARSIRPEKPPRLSPRFVLVLGAREDETVRRGATSEVRLKTWNPARFAEAMVVVTLREIFKNEDITNLTRDTLIAAQASASVSELARKQ
jgi:hypothetical protein